MASSASVVAVAARLVPGVAEALAREMKRGDFLKAALLPLGVAAADVARRVDPGGEPVEEGAPLIVVKDGASISNFRIDATGSRRKAVAEVPSQTKGVTIRDGFIKGG